MLRLQIPRILYTSDAIAMNPKADDDLMMGMEDQGTGQPKRRQALRNGENARTERFIRTKINWEKFIGHFQGMAAEDLFAAVRRLLLQTETTMPDAVLEKYLDQTNRNSQLQSAAIRYMGTPEYQLC